MGRHLAVLALLATVLGVVTGCGHMTAPSAVQPTSTAATMPLVTVPTTALPGGLTWTVAMRGAYQGVTWEVTKAVASDGLVCLNLRTGATPDAAPLDATAFCKSPAAAGSFAAEVTAALKDSVVVHLAFAPADAVFSGPALVAPPTFAAGLVALVLDGTKRRLDVAIGSTHLTCALSDYAFPGDCPPT